MTGSGAAISTAIGTPPVLMLIPILGEYARQLQSIERRQALEQSLSWREEWIRVLRTLRSTQQPPSPQPQATQRQTVAVLTRYSPGMLPITIPPERDAYVLQLTPSITTGLFTVPNMKSSAVVWPNDIRGIPDQIIVCELTNHEEKALLAPEIIFEATFYRLKVVGQAMRQSNPDGTLSLTWPAPAPEHDSVTFTRGTKAYARSEQVAQIKHPVSLPVLSPRQTERIYLVNQSRWIAGFNLPSGGSAVLDGRRIPIALLRPQVNILDAIPRWQLPPTGYYWHGVPDAPTRERPAF